MKYLAVLALILAIPVNAGMANWFSEGIASWYGDRFAGRKTASGEIFDPSKLTAAHRTLPFGTKVKVLHKEKSVIVKINDRGPFHSSRVIDLSKAAAKQIGLLSRGTGRVTLSIV